MISTEPSRIPSLDGIRAIAALMVMFFHFVGHHGEPGRVVQAFVIGQTGVDLFFVLSGLLITRILLLSKESPHYFRSFYGRRVLRIFPLYYAFLAIYFFVLPHLLATPVPPLHTQMWSWLYLENVPRTFTALTTSGPDHFWSLAVEEQFYLVWPLLVFVLSRRRFQHVLTATLVLSPLLRLLFLHGGIGVFYFTLTRLDALGYGAVLAMLLTSKESVSRRQIWIFRVLAAGLAIAMIPAFVVFSGSGLAWLQALKLSLIPAFYFAVIGFCIFDPLARRVTGLLSNRLLRWLGGISYGLYVFHPTCFMLVRRVASPHSLILDLVLSFGVTIAVAFVSFRYFESPLLRLKRYFRYEMAVQRSPHSAVLLAEGPAAAPAE